MTGQITDVVEKTSGGVATIVLNFTVRTVFLMLVTKYESYLDSNITLFTVFLPLLGALGMIWSRVGCA
jgi:multidrug efflux pump subunit AcrB